MKKQEIITLTDEQKKAIREEIRAFYDEERGEDIGIIHQQQILDLFLERLAPMIYNKALDDARYFYRRQQENAEAEYYTLYKDEG